MLFQCDCWGNSALSTQQSSCFYLWAEALHTNYRWWKHGYGKHKVNQYIQPYQGTWRSNRSSPCLLNITHVHLAKLFSNTCAYKTKPLAESPAENHPFLLLKITHFSSEPFDMPGRTQLSSLHDFRRGKGEARRSEELKSVQLCMSLVVI